MARDIVLKVLLFRRASDPETWIAQAIEKDIVAHGPDVEHAKRAFERTVHGYIVLASKHGQEPLASLRPAPPVFSEQWNLLSAAMMQAERR